MPNTTSAERRMRNSRRKHLHNLSVKSRLRRLEKKYRAVLASGERGEAVKLLPGVSSAYDKAVKSGVMHRSAANRKKSRLSLALNRVHLPQ
ncbi:MAG: 30S ribosomal protein S20 [Verrucomicrobiia bacterium]